MAALNPEVAQAWLADFAGQVHEHAAWLTDLDREIGDADHGSNLDRGMRAVSGLDAASFDSAAAYLKKAGMTLVSTVGGASGPLYGTFFLRLAGALPADGEISVGQWADAWQAAVAGVQQRGKAQAGDKTMLDALLPAVAALTDGGVDAWADAVSAAEQGRDQTADLVARKGRASYLGERAVGHLDPGACSAALLVGSAARTLA